MNARTRKAPASVKPRLPRTPAPAEHEPDALAGIPADEATDAATEELPADEPADEPADDAAADEPAANEPPTDPREAAAAARRARPDLPRRTQTVNFEGRILDEARAAAFYLAAYVPEAQTYSLADIVNRGVAAEVKRLSKRFAPESGFPPVAVLQSGRPRRGR